MAGGSVSAEAKSMETRAPKAGSVTQPLTCICICFGVKYSGCVCVHAGTCMKTSARFVVLSGCVCVSGQVHGLQLLLQAEQTHVGRIQPMLTTVFHRVLFRCDDGELWIKCNDSRHLARSSVRDNKRSSAPVEGFIIHPSGLTSFKDPFHPGTL